MNREITERIPVWTSILYKCVYFGGEVTIDTGNHCNVSHCGESLCVYRGYLWCVEDVCYTWNTYCVENMIKTHSFDYMFRYSWGWESRDLNSHSVAIECPTSSREVINITLPWMPIDEVLLATTFCGGERMTKCREVCSNFRPKEFNMFYTKLDASFFDHISWLLPTSSNFQLKLSLILCVKE